MILHLFCELFGGDTLQFAYKGFSTLIASGDGVDSAADFFRKRQFGNPIGRNVFHMNVSVPTELEIFVLWFCGGRDFEIRVRVGKIIFRDTLVLNFQRSDPLIQLLWCHIDCMFLFVHNDVPFL